MNSGFSPRGTLSPCLKKGEGEKGGGGKDESTFGRFRLDWMRSYVARGAMIAKTSRT